ncbi:MAG: transcription elongation factor GreA [Acidobacteriia bacterium]|nr:transcription elongation factor GreA [Terriglobia bacterium]
MSNAVVRQLEAEIKGMEHELHHVLPKELERARALGDLRENAEYQAAKERKDYLMLRLAQMKKRLADASMVNFDRIPRGEIAFGSTVTLKDLQRDTEVVYTLVSAEESDVSQGKISISSPIGRSLLGKKIGDAIEVRTPAGVREFEVLKMMTIHDSKP